MRFVLACDQGYVGEIPWNAFAHGFDTSKCKHRDQLIFKRHAGGSGGLESLSVECTKCGSSRRLDELKNVNSVVRASTHGRGRVRIPRNASVAK